MVSSYYNPPGGLFQQGAAAILDGLGQVGGLDIRAGVQVGDGPGHAENAVVAAAGEAQPVKGPLHEPLSRRVQQAVLPDHGRGHIGIAADAGAGKALLLKLPGGVDPGADLSRGLRLFLAAHGLVLHRRHLDVHIDAVQQGAEMRRI